MSRAATVLLWLPLLAALVVLPVQARETPWTPVTAAVHLHTSQFSSGSHTLQELVNLARASGVEALVLSDHDRIAMSYGLPPFRNLLSLTLSRNAVLKQGAQEYLEAVDRVAGANQDMVLVPGLESAPFYYWSGSLWEGSLTARNWRKHIHVIGLDDPEVLENLPIVGNGPGGHVVRSLFPRFGFFAGLLVVSGLFLFRGGAWRWPGRICLIVAVLGAFDAQPFRSSPFDPFHGDQGVAPYQALIDYVDRHGGMTFWAHPEANYGAKGTVFRKSVAGFSLPPVGMQTERYPGDLLLTDGYTGFEALYGDTIHVTEPGKEWDRALLAYTEGRRKTPPWGLCGIDFHKLGQNSWSYFDRGQTVFLVGEKSRKGVLDAMRHGRMYAVYQGGKGRLRLETFLLASAADEKRAISGEQLDTGAAPIRLRAQITCTGSEPVVLDVQLIDSGKVVKRFEGKTPLSIEHDLSGQLSQGFIRLDARAVRYRLLSNPIFYRRSP
jgi:hypothetical protein